MSERFTIHEGDVGTEAYRDFFVQELRTKRRAAEQLAGDRLDRIAELEAKLRVRIEEANNAAHVIVEAGIIPGQHYSCRCEECAAVAIQMDDAGYMGRVKDRWWKQPEELNG